jgi:hypothetical protein
MSQYHDLYKTVMPMTAYDRAVRDEQFAMLERTIHHQRLEPLRLAGRMRGPHDRVDLPTIQEMVEKYPRSMSSSNVDYEYVAGARVVEVRAIFDVTYRMPRDLYEYLESLRALKGL